MKKEIGAPTAPTADTRRAAWEILDQVDRRAAWADELLGRRLAGPGWVERERRLCRELVLGTVKARLFLDFALTPHWRAGRPPQPRVLGWLRLGAYQLLFLSKIPAYAAVQATVESAKVVLPPAQIKFVNAVLRALARTGAPPLPSPDQDVVAHLSLRHSHPEWLVRRWVGRFGREAAESMLAAGNEAPPLAGRINLLRRTREAALAEWHAVGLEAAPGAAPGSVVFTSAGEPARIPGLAEGWLYFQDAAAQLVGYVADPAPGMHCLDVCSAPGGKATHLAELMNDTGDVLAYDRHPGKLARVEENARRLGLHSVRIQREAPGTDVSADRVLVDAPCSGLGTLRRHAEARWRIAEDDFPRLARAQRVLLHQAAAWVKPGGDLIYSTCTTEPEENEDVVSGFLAGHPEFKLRPGPGARGVPDPTWWGSDGFFRTFPGHPDEDGMFAARMRRSLSK